MESRHRCGSTEKNVMEDRSSTLKIEGPTIERILADLKPEAAYFFADNDGQRSGSIVFDMKDTSQIPAIAEPWFPAFNAKVSLRPIMTPQDLATAGPSIGKAAQQYGKCMLSAIEGICGIWGRRSVQRLVLGARGRDACRRNPRRQPRPPQGLWHRALFGRETWLGA